MALQFGQPQYYSETMNIRQARKEEAEALTEISFAAKAYWNYPEEYFILWQNELTISKQYIEDNTVFVFHQENWIAAFASLIILEKPLNVKDISLQPGLWLDHMFVKPDNIEKGIGTALFHHCSAFAFRLGFQKMRILADPNSLGFYLKMNCRYLDDYPSTIQGRTTPYLEYILDEE